MKNNFFQRKFGRKQQETLPRNRRLSLEALENREMLNADWGGFAPEVTTEYHPESTGYSVALPSNVDAIQLVNLEGDAKSELVSIYGKGKTVSVYTPTSTGEYKLVAEQSISTLNTWGLYSDAVFHDFNGDGYQEMMLLTSNGLSIEACVYTWNSATSSFAAGKTYTLDVTPFVGTASRYVFTEVSGAIVDNGSNCDLVLQVSTLTPASQTTSTCVYANVGSASFGTSPAVKSAVTGTLLGSTKIDGESYLILKEATNSTNYLVLSKLGSSSVSKTYYDFSGYGSSFVYNWVVERDGFLTVGAVLGSASNGGLATLNVSSAPVDGEIVDATTLGQWISCKAVTMNASSVGAIGDAGGDSDPEILVANDDEKSSIFYLGDASTRYGYTFTESQVVVSSPDYNTVYIGDYNCNGKQNALLVGSSYLYVADVAENGSLSNQRELYRFTQPVSNAVFGDFNGDGLVDFAIQYKANVSSSFQLFMQVANGQYVAVTTQSIPGVFADFSVGKFSQTKVDEIAVLYTLYKNQTTMTFVNTYKFDSSKTALVATTSSSYIGSGASITSGSLFGSSVDDLVVCNTLEDTVTVLRNTGSAFSASTASTRYDGANVCYPTSASIGDFNGDGKADLAVMNSSLGTNVAEVVYYLRSSDTTIGAKPTGRVRVNSTVTTIDNTAVVGELQAVNLNGDAYDDLIFVRQSTAGASYASVILGNGEASVFNSLNNVQLSCDASKYVGVAMAEVDLANSSYDLVWVQDKKVGVLLNSDSSVVTGRMEYVLQSLSSQPGANYAEAVTTQRDWLDEWSNYYVDVWANADGSGAVASVAGSFEYDSAYFTFVKAVPQSKYTVIANGGEPGVVSFAANGSGVADSEGWVLVARLQFKPVDNGGLALASDGKLYSVDPGFKASASAQTINGATVATATAPAGVDLFPVAYDLNDNGEVDLEDFSKFIAYYPANPVSSIPVVKDRVLDVNGNNQYDLDDFSYAIASYPSKASGGLDSGYSKKPTVANASAAELDRVFAILDTEEDMFVNDELAVAVEEVVAAGPVVREAAQRVASTDAAVETLYFCGPMLQEKTALDLDVELELEL